MKNQKTLLTNIGKLYLAGDEINGPLTGAAMAQINTISNAFLLMDELEILDYGTMPAELPQADTIVDAAGGLVFPSFVDAHTHIVFAATRESEFKARLQGKSYEAIAEEGGGILNSARRLQAMSEDELFEQAWVRLQKLIAKGTAAIEIKSGYGLTVEAELKMLRVIRKLGALADIPVKATFLGAHAIPLKYKENRTAYVDLIIDEMLPKIAEEELADYLDAFCEQGFFTLAETERIVRAAQPFGLKAKLHVNQLSNSGGVQLGCKLNALSVDHLEEIGPAEIAALKESNTFPVVLPGCSFFINIPYAPGRKLIDSGLPLVIASDYNPGSTPNGNMFLTFAIACTQMRLMPEEALVAMTLNAAHAIELGDVMGSISRGKKSNIILTQPISDLVYLAYDYSNAGELMRAHFINGKNVLNNKP